MERHRAIVEELKRKQVNHKVHYHENQPVPVKSPADFASALGYPVERILKTLFLSSDQMDKYFLVVCPANAQVDFKSLALMFGVTKVQVAPRDALQQRLGYLPTGVSPIGADQYEVAVDNSVVKYDTVLVGGGVPGIEIEIAPADLVKVTVAKTGSFVRG